MSAIQWFANVCYKCQKTVLNRVLKSEKPNMQIYEIKRLEVSVTSTLMDPHSTFIFENNLTTKVCLCVSLTLSLNPFVPPRRDSYKSLLCQNCQAQPPLQRCICGSVVSVSVLYSKDCRLESWHMNYFNDIRSMRSITGERECQLDSQRRM